MNKGWVGGRLICSAQAMDLWHDGGGRFLISMGLSLTDVLSG